MTHLSLGLPQVRRQLYRMLTNALKTHARGQHSNSHPLYLHAPHLLYQHLFRSCFLTVSLTEFCPTRNLKSTNILYICLCTLSLLYTWASLVAQTVKNLPARQETWGSIPGLGRSPEGGHGNPL